MSGLMWFKFLYKLVGKGLDLWFDDEFKQHRNEHEAEAKAAKLADDIANGKVSPADVYQDAKVVQ